jgi:hypothetical protein
VGDRRLGRNTCRFRTQINNAGILTEFAELTELIGFTEFTGFAELTEFTGFTELTGFA